MSLRLLQTGMVFFLVVVPTLWAAAEPLPGTRPLEMQGDYSAQMVAGIDRFLERELEKSIKARESFWKRNTSSAAAYEKSIATNRAHLRTIIGAVNPRVKPVKLEFIGNDTPTSLVAQTARVEIFAVRWPVYEGVHGEGLLLRPKGPPRAGVVALPDADQTPEMLAGLAPGLAPESQFALRLAEHGCLVLIPTLVDRQTNWSGNPALQKQTPHPHREWIYRMAFELGRHLIGYEVEKVSAALDWLEQQKPNGQSFQLGVAGTGEGALIAFYSAAVDPRIEATLVSGYFNSRQRLWEEPIYRNVQGLLREFGDAEIASLIVPRKLVIEHSQAPEWSAVAKPRITPGKITTPEFASVEAEANRAKALVGSRYAECIQLVYGSEGMLTGPASSRALLELFEGLGLGRRLNPPGETPRDARALFNPAERQRRTLKELEDHTQKILQACERTRLENFWKKARMTNATEWAKALPPFQSQLWEVLGKFPAASLPANPRSRKLQETPKWTSYDVVLDVWPEVFAWGTLLLPKDLKPGERRPVVVTQHGLEGLPQDTITEDTSLRAFAAYKAFSARLAERGFIVFAPHNPYRGGDNFRVLQRKANPLGKSLFSVIIAQHDRILDWLSAQPFVDPQRIGFYGLSYGGKTAMRVPALLERYCLSICSGDFNEWVRKNAGTDYPSSYLFTGEYEIFEWDLGHTFN